MIYLDANFFIFAAIDNTEKGENARKFFQKIIEGKKALTSVLAIDEIMWVLIKNKKKHLVNSVVEGIYKIPNLKVSGVLRDIPLRAMSYLDKLAPRDAFHVAVMESLDINEIITDDSDFEKIKWIKRIKI